MARHLLNAKIVSNARPRAAPYRLNDGDGLTLYIAPSGVRSWQYRYTLASKQQTATLGRFPDMSLADARHGAEAARAIAKDGGHVTAAKRIAKVKRAATRIHTFKAVREDWLESEAARARWSDKYVGQIRALFENHLKSLDYLPVSEIVASITAPKVRAVGKTAPMMEEKVERALHAVMDHAVRQGHIERNPLPPRRPTPVNRRNYPAVTDLPGIGAILRAARASDPCKGITRAHELVAFTAQRIAEVVGAEWTEFDLVAGTWAIPRSRMKRKDEARGPHVVPLPAALIERLREWRHADAGSSVFVCPAPRDPERHITPEGVEKWMRDSLALGGKHSPHSWRSAFSTICREAAKEGDVVEAQLDHQVGTKVASAYDRAKRLELRRALMAWYEGQLIGARDGAEIVVLSRGAAR